MAAKFVLKRSTNGKYHFNLQAANGEIIASSELYESKASAQKGIESVRVNAPRAALDDKSEESAPKPKAPARPAASARPEASARSEGSARPETPGRSEGSARPETAAKAPQAPAKP
jgi:uncharacterized protein YegP (UPF0339 family)